MKQVTIYSTHVFQLTRNDGTQIPIAKGLSKIDATDALHPYLKHHGVQIHSDAVQGDGGAAEAAIEASGIDVAKLENIAALTVPKLVASLPGLSVDELLALRDIEEAELDRPKAISAIDDAVAVKENEAAA